jgi:hypothetical protein
MVCKVLPDEQARDNLGKHHITEITAFQILIAQSNHTLFGKISMNRSRL